MLLSFISVHECINVEILNSADQKLNITLIIKGKFNNAKKYQKTYFLLET
jgi:hypothetical protein